MLRQQIRSDDPKLSVLLGSIQACRVCRDEPEGSPLGHEPRPVFQIGAGATLCIAGQAPGTRVHATGVPYNDPSGARLRDWLGLDRAAFYDPTRVAIVPMGFCFPGHDRAGGDLPPRRECANRWHDRVFAALPSLRLVLAIGAYAHAYHLGRLDRGSVTRTVADWREILAETGGRVLPLPHPSWRNNAWISRNPWFAAELLPALRREVAAALNRPGAAEAVHQT
jgi:uracil-DNA glycosylase